MLNEQLAWLIPFNQLERPGLSWRTEDHEGWRWSWASTEIATGPFVAWKAAFTTGDTGRRGGK